MVQGWRTGGYRLLMRHVFFTLAVTSYPGLGVVTPDLSIVDTTQNALKSIEKCRARGYDGLASAATPEIFNYVKNFTYDMWKNQGGVYVGLVFKPGDKPRWADGTVAATDTPWGWDDPPLTTDITLYGRLTKVGKLRLFGGVESRLAVCGRYHADYNEVRGSSTNGYQPGGQSSSLSAGRASSYLKCVSLCGQDLECRAAAFYPDLQFCKTFGPGKYTELRPGADVKTFVRVGFQLNND